MEINALFDLWDKFSQVEVDLEGSIVSHFYDFSPGTSSLEIVGWFMRQNPLFYVQESHVDGRRTFNASNAPTIEKGPVSYD